MKTSMKKIAAVVALTALVAGPASAMVTPNDVRSNIAAVVGTGNNVIASVSGDVVTLSGYFADAGDKSAALQAAKSADGVDRVIDLTTVSN